MRLFDIAGRITETATRVCIAFATVCPEAKLRRGVAHSFQFAGPQRTGPEPPDTTRLDNPDASVSDLKSQLQSKRQAMSSAQRDTQPSIR